MPAVRKAKKRRLFPESDAATSRKSNVRNLKHYDTDNQDDEGYEKKIFVCIGASGLRRIRRRTRT
jgi:hypothetical protein